MGKRGRDEHSTGDNTAQDTPSKRTKEEEEATDREQAAADTAPVKEGDGVEQEGNGAGGHEKKEEDDEDDLPVYGSRRPGGGGVRKGAECPYLDTISRQNLDFDFEKCCSVSLSPVNVYVCLVCGKYFQGRGPSTHAYTHSLETGHHMFMKLDSGKVYCLPDMYEVVDRSLHDIQHVLDPQFDPAELQALDSDVAWSRALDGSEYMPGLVGLNNMKCNDYVNVTVQALSRVTPLRDFFLRPGSYAGCSSLLVQRFGELLRKIWNPRNFKGQVSPHEFMQAVMSSSKKRFTIDKQSDPLDFYSWLLNALHLGLTGGRRRARSVVTECLQGELQVMTEAGTGKAKESTEHLIETVPFLLLGLDLPAAPLFKDNLERNIIPQVPIFDILQKFDGETATDSVRGGRQRFRLTKLPPYLLMHVKRFTKNNFFVEKNPTIVNFPVKNLDISAVLPLPKGKDGSLPPAKYDLVANIVHEGKAGEGSYRVHIQRAVEDVWYEVQDLHVVDVLPQMVALSEAYMQVYQLQRPAVLPGPAKSASGKL